MKFVQLVSTLQLIDAQLARALAGNDRAAQHAKLLRNSADLLDRIETYEPESTDELREMVGFFVARAASHASSTTGKHDFSIAASLMARYASAGLPCRKPESGRDSVSPNGIGSEPEDLARHIVHANDRISAIDTNYRYLATSRPNAIFYKMSPLGLVGRHLCETIGSDRFHKRAREKIDGCLDGNAQDYLFSYQDPIAGQRVMRCRMTPIRDGKKRVYCALVRVLDATGTRHAGQIDQQEAGMT